MARNRGIGTESAFHRQAGPLFFDDWIGVGGLDQVTGAGADNRPQNRPARTRVPEKRKPDGTQRGTDLRTREDIAMSEGAKPVILVVEDDPDLRTILRMQLTCHDFIVREAVNGLEGFQSMQAGTPDCVILDLMMPVLDGFGFLKRVRSLMTMVDVPILILTASEDERNKVRGYQYQADSYMSKPYDLDALTNEVRRLLATRTHGLS
jgi:CheY-like chemotaxis protein